MIDFVHAAADKLDDPTLLQWALHRYRDARQCLPERSAAMEEAWFNDGNLQRWLEAGAREERLVRLFMDLPLERFAKLAPLIAEHWPEWPESLGYYAAPILVHHLPRQALQLFTDFVDSDTTDSRKTLAILEQLPHLPEDAAGPLLKTIAQRIWVLDDGYFKKSLLATLVKPTLALDVKEIGRLVSALIATAQSTEDLDKILSGLSFDLFGQSSYYKLAVLLQDEESAQTFQSLARLFRPDAPLAELDRIVVADEPLPEALALLESTLVAAGAQIREALQATDAKEDKDRRAQLGCFVLAAVAHAFEAETLDASTLELDEALQALTVDLSELRHFNVLAERLQDLDQQAVIQAVQQRLPEVHESYGATHLAKLMGVLSYEAFVPLLIDSLSTGSGDYLCEAAQQALLRIGVPARDSLIERWESLDDSQQIYGGSVIGTVGGDAAVDFLVQVFPTLFRENMERWCDLAEDAPAPRLIELLEPELRRKQEPIDQAFYVLCRLLEIDHSALEAARERMAERRRQMQEQLAEFKSRDFLPRDSVSLPLRCPNCGDTNRYDVKEVLVSGNEGDPYVADEFPCTSCGEWVDFELAGLARMAIVAELVKLNAAYATGRKTKSPLKPVRVTLNGQDASIQELLASRRDAVERHPKSVRNLLLLGETYYDVVHQPRRALQVLLPILERSPFAVEAALLVARIWEEQDQGEASFKLLDGLLLKKTQWHFFSTQQDKVEATRRDFAQLYNRLRHRFGVKDRPQLAAAGLPGHRKVGRNDPCPCGSGKKYKKCCMIGETALNA